MTDVQTVDGRTGDRKLALVTGASSGIGYELAKQFATNGYDLIVNSEDARIDSAAKALTVHGGEAIGVEADLATEEGVEMLASRIEELARPLDAAAINAGVGVGGEFVGGTSWQDERRVIDLNVVGTTHLAKRVLEPMVERGEGRVLFTASVASSAPGPYHAVYAASKAFVLSLAEALRYEVKDTGVTVTALMPGPTDTEFFERADMLDTPVGRSEAKDDPADVARAGFEALMSGADHIVVGMKNKVQVTAANVLPDPVTAAQQAKQTAPDSEREESR